MTAAKTVKKKKVSHKILLVEDHIVVRAGVKFMLKNMPEYSFEIHETDSYNEVFKNVQVFNYDIILLDIELHDKNGLDILKKLKQVSPESKVIMLTMYNDLLTIKKALKNGAEGYLLKNLIEEEISLAIKVILQGKTYICNEASHILLNEKKNKIFELLSSREKEIVGLITEGYSNVEIGAQLSLSHRTIDTHKQNIYSKLGIKKNIELVKYAIKNNLA